jgi:Mrp family chromosome partitioning ATPase
MSSKIEKAMQRVAKDSGSEASTLPVDARPGGAAGIARMRESDPLTPQAVTRMGVIHPASSTPTVVNAFRQLRTSIMRRLGNRNFLMLMTGVSEGSGVSFMARNLAAAVAMDETKTAVIIDCNIADARTSDLFARGAPAQLGLTDYLEGDVDRGEAIIHETGIPRLRIVPVGRYRGWATEYFTGTRLRGLLQEILTRYPDRYVIVDAPPVLTTADTRILTEICHSVLLVVPYGGASSSQIEAAAATIPPDHLVGTVFNDDPVAPFAA